MSLRKYLLVLALLAGAAPLMSQAGEITLLPSIKLQIGDRDHYGNYWDGGHWRDRAYWDRNFYWRDRGWHRHDHGRHRGWDKKRAWEQGYREGRRDGRHDRGPRGHHHRH